jgi:L-alanine-DL-glutamate epimerase-like enolase superfamily enzyme
MLGSMSKRSRTLSIERAATRFAEPFRISGYLFEAMPSIVAHISDGEETGRGEAAGVYYLGDDQARMIADVEGVASSVEAGATRAELQNLLPPCGARNALDCALWELEARTARRPVWSLAGLPSPRSLLTTFTLPADEPAQIAEKIKRFGFAKAIKLKLEGNLDKDRERVAAVRAARPDVWLSVDANQGFTSKDLDGLAQIARDFSVSLIEQPVARGDEAALAGWRPGVPVAADESILHLGELDDRASVFDVINIKLDKCGGLTEALAMAHAARRTGKEVMVGNMGGSTLAMAPGFVIGQLCDFIDLDGPFSLADDPLASQIYVDGSIFVPDEIWGSTPA